MLFFGIFGNYAVYLQISGQFNVIEFLNTHTTEATIIEVLHHLPFPNLIIVLFLIVVFAVATFMKINNEALNSVVMAVIGWYFGQKSNGNSNGGTAKPSELPPSTETVQQ